VTTQREAPPAPGGESGRTLAEKLERLFRTARPEGRDGQEGREEYSLEEAAQAIRRRGGPTISASYLWLLRTGRKTNPTKRHLEALAAFFGVPPAYFFDDPLSARVDVDLDLLGALRTESVRRIAIAAAGLSPGGRRSVEMLIEHIREIEQGDERRQRRRPSRPPRPSRSGRPSESGTAPAT
jgi:transcriptional regulator with XRE-family HTH domain